MKDLIRLYTDEMIWPNGIKFHEEPIQVATNGWVYKPSKLIVKGEKTTWGKGHEAQRKALDWLLTRLNKAMEEANYTRPTSVGRARVDVPGTWHNDGMVATIWDPVFGYVEFGMMVEMSSYSMDFNTRYRVNMSPALSHLILGKPTTSSGWRHELSASERFSDHEIKDGTSVAISKLQKRINSFRASPFSEMQAMMKTRGELQGADLFRLLQLPQSLSFPTSIDWQPYDADEIKDLTNSDRLSIRYGYIGQMDRYLSNDLVVFSVQEMKLLEQLFKSFRYLGVRCDVSWRYGGGSEASKRAEAITLEIPARNEKGQEHPHSITLNERGIRVDCGYVKSEQRYLEYQQRAALDFLKEIHADSDDYEDMVIDMKGSE